MTYKEAKIIAENINDQVNACNEYEKGYHFFQNTDREVTGDSGFVILKESGEVIRWIEFIFQYSPEIDPIHLDFEKGCEL